MNFATALGRLAKSLPTIDGQRQSLPDSTLAVTDENLPSLDKLYEERKLTKFSKIENKNFKVK